MRFMPIEGVCYAGLEDLSKLGQKLLPEHFPADKDAAAVTVSLRSSQQCQRSCKSMYCSCTVAAGILVVKLLCCSLEYYMSTEPVTT